MLQPDAVVQAAPLALAVATTACSVHLHPAFEFVQVSLISVTLRAYRTLQSRLPYLA
jgi:hypothetical protein